MLALTRRGEVQKLCSYSPCVGQGRGKEGGEKKGGRKEKDFGVDSYLNQVFVPTELGRRGGKILSARRTSIISIAI